MIYHQLSRLKIAIKPNQPLETQILFNANYTFTTKLLLMKQMVRK